MKMRPSASPIVWFGVFLAAVSAAEEMKIYIRVGGDIVLRPANRSDNPVPKSIKQILWKEGPNKAMEWDADGTGVDYFRHFKERGHLNPTTAEMTITGLLLTDSNTYTPEIDGKSFPPIHLFVRSLVPKPTVSASCDESTCKLTCEGNTTGAGTVTYWWRNSDSKVVHSSTENEYTVHKGNSSSSNEFTCEMDNDISWNKSESVLISFTSPPEKGPKISAGITVLIVLLCVVVLLVAVHKLKSGTWFYEKDSMPWEADFWKRSESHRREAPASNGTPARQRAENAEEEAPMKPS